MAIDILLDSLTNDIQFENFKLKAVSGADLVKQRLLVRLRTFKGEWFLDTEEGIPYYRNILVKAPLRESVEAIFRSAILQTEGVLDFDRGSDGVAAFALDYDNGTRNLTLVFSVKSEFGVINVNEII